MSIAGRNDAQVDGLRPWHRIVCGHLSRSWQVTPVRHSSRFAKNCSSATELACATPSFARPCVRAVSCVADLPGARVQLRRRPPSATAIPRLIAATRCPMPGTARTSPIRSWHWLPISISSSVPWVLGECPLACLAASWSMRAAMGREWPAPGGCCPSRFRLGQCLPSLQPLGKRGHLRAHARPVARAMAAAPAASTLA